MSSDRDYESENVWTHLASRRERERDGAGVAATLSHQQHVIEGVLEDISRCGGRFRTPDLTIDLADNAWVTIRFRCFRHATREEIEALAQIVWSKDYHDGTRGLRALGLEFGDPIDLRRVEFTR